MKKNTLILSLFITTSCLADSKLVKSQFTEESFKLPTTTSESEWEMGIELGATLTSGNTDTQTLKGKLEGGLDYLSGRISYMAQLYQKTVDDERSADKWKVGIKHNIHFTEHSSSFSIFEYARDKFASVKNRATLAAGYTQRLYDNETLSWNADIGPGIVKTKMESTKETLHIAHLGSKFTMKLSDTTDFQQILVADFDISGGDNDVYRSESSVSASVVENLKMKVSYAMKFDESVQVANEKLDTETSVSLVYIF